MVIFADEWVIIITAKTRIIDPEINSENKDYIQLRLVTLIDMAQLDSIHNYDGTLVKEDYTVLNCI